MYDSVSGDYSITGISTGPSLTGLTGSFTNPVDNYTSGSNWTETAHVPGWDSRSYFGSVVFSNKLWVIGGGVGTGNPQFKDVWSSPDGTNWTQVATNQTWGNRSEFVCLVFSNKIWIIGGVQDAVRTNDVWRSSDGTNWTQITAGATWSSRVNAGGLVYDNKMWILGGYDGQYTNDVWYSTDGAAWTCATNGAAWGGRFFHSALVHSNMMWIMGGQGFGGSCKDVWYATNGADWTQATAAAGWNKRHDFGAAAYNNRMFVYGGYLDIMGFYSGYTNDIWSSTDGATWTAANSGCDWSIRAGFGCPVFRNSLWTLGGAWPVTNNVWRSGADLYYAAETFDSTNVLWNVGLGAKWFLHQSLTNVPAPIKGATYFNSSDNIFYKCTNGTSWTAF
jgi:hypothetical protein